MSKTARIFIDGEAGTTGLGIRERLSGLREISLIAIDPARRKDAEARRAAMAESDLTVLCLPDAAARESVEIAIGLGANAPKVLDASSAHRVAPGWVYGFPELEAGQADKIAAAPRVSVPGCYPTGAVSLLRPLVDAGFFPPDYPVTINAVSGYSGGGKSMIEAHEASGGPAFNLYGLSLEHKHVPEIEKYSGMPRRPIFAPAVGHYRQGMLVSVPLHLDLLTGKPDGAALHDALATRYAGMPNIRVLPPLTEGEIEPEGVNGTNILELRVFHNAARGQAVLVARLDNLGKGASGAAVQNIHLMLGLDEIAREKEFVHA